MTERKDSYIEYLEERRDNVKAWIRIVDKLISSGFMEALGRKIDKDLVDLLKEEKSND